VKGESVQGDILVMLPNWLGDVMMSLPSLNRFRQCVPTSSLHVLCRAPFQELLSWQPFVDQVHAGKGSKMDDLWRAWRLRSMGLNMVVVLPNSFRSGLQAALIGANRRIGYRGECRGFFLTDELPGKGDPSLHQSQRYEFLFRHAGMEGEMSFCPFVVPLDKVQEVGVRFLGKGFQDRCQYVVACPGAGFGEAKRWPPEAFASVCQGLLDQAVNKVLIVGSGSERGICDELALHLEKSHSGCTINLCGKTDLAELACLLSRAVVCLANDSGPMHLAAGLGVRTVGVFLSTSTEVSRPFGERVASVEANVSCRPCFKRRCPRKTWACLHDIDTHEVLEQALLLISR